MAAKIDDGKEIHGYCPHYILVDENGIIRDKIEGRGVDTKNHAVQILEKMKTGRD
jgi:peroxiredoxin Q/BCP